MVVCRVVWLDGVVVVCGIWGGWARLVGLSRGKSSSRVSEHTSFSEYTVYPVGVSQRQWIRSWRQFQPIQWLMRVLFRTLFEPPFSKTPLEFVLVLVRYLVLRMFVWDRPQNPLIIIRPGTSANIRIYQYGTVGGYFIVWRSKVQVSAKEIRSTVSG